LNGQEVNNLVGTHLRSFTDIKETINHDKEWLEAIDLKAEPYLLSADDETLIKSAILQLDQTLDDVDMTFIERLTGMW
jgi:hypothetical protein